MSTDFQDSFTGRLDSKLAIN